MISFQAGRHVQCSYVKKKGLHNQSQRICFLELWETMVLTRLLAVRQYYFFQNHSHVSTQVLKALHNFVFDAGYFFTISHF